jgi:hypothetical protein
MNYQLTSSSSIKEQRKQQQALMQQQRQQRGKSNSSSALLGNQSGNSVIGSNVQGGTNNPSMVSLHHAVPIEIRSSSSISTSYSYLLFFIKNSEQTSSIVPQTYSSEIFFIYSSSKAIFLYHHLNSSPRCLFSPRSYSSNCNITSRII